MDMRDARPAIGDLPLDLFGEAQESESPAPRDPNVGCHRCGFPLTEGLSTCSACGAQNELIPIITSTPPALNISADEDPSLPSSYAGRVARAFGIVFGEILLDIGRIVLEGIRHIFDLSFLRPPYADRDGVDRFGDWDE